MYKSERLETDRSTRSSPHRISLVDETRKSMNRVFEESDGLLPVDVNPPTWKKNYVNFPYLSQVSRRCLVITDTSDPTERLFSVTGQVVKRGNEMLSVL